MFLGVKFHYNLRALYQPFLFGRCLLGLEFCDQKRVPQDAQFFDVTCLNYYYCRSWVLPWPLPLHRMPAHPGSDFDPPIPQDYYLSR